MDQCELLERAQKAFQKANTSQCSRDAGIEPFFGVAGPSQRRTEARGCTGPDRVGVGGGLVQWWFTFTHGGAEVAPMVRHAVTIIHDMSMHGRSVALLRPVERIGGRLCLL